MKKLFEAVRVKLMKARTVLAVILSLCLVGFALSACVEDPENKVPSYDQTQGETDDDTVDKSETDGKGETDDDSDDKQGGSGKPSGSEKGDDHSGSGSTDQGGSWQGGSGKPSEGEQSPSEGDEDNTDEGEKEMNEIFLTIGTHKIAVKLEKNEATVALIEILKQSDITYTASEYGGFEKVGSLGHTLPRSDTQMTTKSGDVVLYSGNQIVLFYGSNTWSYTRLGKIQGFTAEELRSILTETDPTTITIGLK